MSRARYNSEGVIMIDGEGAEKCSFKGKGDGEGVMVAAVLTFKIMTTQHSKLARWNNRCTRPNWFR